MLIQRMVDHQPQQVLHHLHHNIVEQVNLLQENGQLNLVIQVKK